MHLIVRRTIVTSCPRRIRLVTEGAPILDARLVDEIDRSSTTSIAARNNEDPFPTVNAPATVRHTSSGLKHFLIINVAGID